MWRQYAGYKPRVETEGERLARERPAYTWPFRLVVTVEHIPYVHTIT